MLKKNGRAINFLNALTDGALNFGAFLLAYWLRFFVFAEDGGFQPLEHYIDIAVINAVATMLIYFIFRLYAPKRHSRYTRDIRVVLQANIVDIMLLGVLLYFWRFDDFSRMMMFYYFLLSTFLVLGKHLTGRVILQYVRRRNRNLRHILLIGGGDLAARYCASVQESPHLGYAIDGYVVPEDRPVPPPVAGLNRFGTLADLPEILSEHTFDEAVIALDESDTRFTHAAIDPCNRSGQRFSIIPYFTQYIFAASAPTVETVGIVQLYGICASPLDNPANRALKRLVDVVAAGALLLVTSPILLLTAVGVKLSSPGPVFFAQERVGHKKATFRMYKFRSMQVNDTQDTGWSTKQDTRVTPFGRFIRKTSIDELPQMWNILKGDMSLVGPRPEIPYHVNHFKEEVPYYMARHQVRPGLTGYAQVNGYRGDTSIEKRIQHDLYYIYNWSLLLDMEIIFKTAFGGMMEKG